MPRYFDIRSTVLIVVGYGILPEEEDRPLAYDLKRAIAARSQGEEGRGAVVVTDMRRASRAALSRNRVVVGHTWPQPVYTKLTTSGRPRKSLILTRVPSDAVNV